MKLHSDLNNDGYRITAYAHDFIAVNGERFTGSIVVCSDQSVRPWALSAIDDLDAESLAIAETTNPEIILLGTGTEQRFPHPALFSGLMGEGIGVEVMSTPAACRTYNILMAEGRKVTALLLLIAD